ncbi:MAG: response regulator [Deltaproteobacteria bacterium]|uniref:Response regulator n=1 Tax=Candidatus Zymogenus saltonus TaxID=2844893 RepID=A0A9D8KFK8_9DELT|nr:response regulator [Candidatus Zymogenus saltonus]
MTYWEIYKIGGKGKINILMIEDDTGYARLVKEMLDKIEESPFDFKRVENLEKGLKIISKEEIDVILLDLLLPDSEGLFTFLKTYSAAPDIPIVVLSSLEDDETALLAIREGAQDFLYKGIVNTNVLVRSIRHSVERKRSGKLLTAARDILDSLLEKKTTEIEDLKKKIEDSEKKRKNLEKKLKEAKSEIKALKG